MDWLRNQKATNPSWFWALIAVAGWSLFLEADWTRAWFFGGVFFDPFGPLPGLTAFPSTGEYLIAVLLSLNFALLFVGLLAGPAWAALVIARWHQRIGGAILAAEGLWLSWVIGLPWIREVSSLVAEGGLDTTDMRFWGADACRALLFLIPPLVAGLLLLASFRRSAERKENGMRMFRWLFGCLALASMACCSVLVVLLWCWPNPERYPSRCIRDPQMVGLGLDSGLPYSRILQTFALALAPWVIGGLVLFIVLGVRWWRSRAPAPPQPTE